MKIYIRHPIKAIKPRPGGDKETFAKYLRDNMSTPQAQVWRYLQKMPHGLYFDTEILILGWIVDFYCPAYRLVIEIDGKTHDSDEAREKDHYRDWVMKRADYTVWRIHASTVYNGDAINLLEKKFTELPRKPTPKRRAPGPLQAYFKRKKKRWTARPSNRKYRKSPRP